MLYDKEGSWISSARVSPRGDLIAFLEHPERRDDVGSVTMLDFHGKARSVSPVFSSVQGLAWDPSGKSVWFTANESGSHGGRAIFNVRIGEKPRLVRRESSTLMVYDVSADRRVLLSRMVERWPVAGRISPELKERDLGWLGTSMPTDISADGSNLLLSVQYEAAGQGYLVYIRNTRRGMPPTLLGEGQPLRISPDGKSVVARYPGAPSATAISQFILLPTGAGQPQPLTHGSINHGWAGWLPDGKHIAFTGNEPGHAPRTWLQDLGGNPAVPITPEGVEGEWISGDGKRLAATDTEGNVWIYPLDGGKPYVLSKLDPGEYILNWSADGRGLLVAKYALPLEVHRIEIATARRRLLFHLAPADTAGIVAMGPAVITPDAKSYVYGYDRILSDLYVATGLR